MGAVAANNGVEDTAADDVADTAADDSSDAEDVDYDSGNIATGDDAKTDNHNADGNIVIVDSPHHARPFD